MHCLALLLLGLTAGPGDNVLYVSWGDQVLAKRAEDRLDTPQKITATLPRWGSMAQASTVYWRASGWRIRRGHEIRRGSVSAYWDAVDAAYAAGDPYTAAGRAAHDTGLAIYGYLTLFDDGSPPDVLYGDSTPFPWQSKFSIEHPEYLVCDRAGKTRQWGVYEYAYPAVRRYMVDRFLAFLDAYDYDGMYACTRTHSKPAEQADQFGYNEPIVAAYQRRYGVDIRTQEFDHDRWERLRGEYLTLFLRELHAELSRRGKKLAIGIPLGDSLGPPYGHLYLDWPRWVSEGLIDELVIGVRTGNEHYPSMRGKDRERGYRFSADEGWGLPDIDTEIRERYGQLCRAAGVKLRVFGLPGPGTERRCAALQLDGVVVSAAALSGVAGYFYIPDHPALAFEDGRLTISVWIKPDSTADYPRLISKYDHTLPGGTGRGWEVYLGDGGRVVFRLNDGAAEAVLTSQAAVEAGRWTHLACVSEGAGGRMRIYLDGREDEATRPAPERLRVVPVEVAIGVYGGMGRPFQGAVADLRLYQGARPPEELLTPADLTAPDLVAVYDFSGTGETIPNGLGAAPAAVRVLLPPERVEAGPTGARNAARLGRLKDAP